jgi:leucyl aminopeptidase (aminopeptidase T)
VLVPRTTISAPPPDAAIAVGARNAIVTCLGVQPKESVVIVTHRGDIAPIAAALLTAATDVGARVEAFVVSPSEASDPRYVRALVGHVATADASILVSSIEGGLPVDLRRRLVEVGTTRRRHGHMIGITAAMMSQAMCADYAEVDRVSRWLASRLTPSAKIVATTAAGTELEIALEPSASVVAGSGVLASAGWTNLPGGEVFGVPARVDGTLVADGGIWMPEGGELPLAFRTRVVFERGEVVRLDGASEPCARLEAALQASSGGRRVGQVGFGTNTGVLAPIGALLQDLKLPGFHLSLGHTCPEVTHAGWDSDVEIPLLTRRASVTIDGAPVLTNGKYPSEAKGA